MTAFAALIIAFHLLAFVLSFSATWETSRQGKEPSTGKLVATFLSFALTAGHLWLAFNQQTLMLYFFATEVTIALLVAAAFCLRHQMICRKYNSSQFNDHQRMLLCLAATSPDFTELLVGDFRDAHFDAVAIHRAVALTEHEIACIERIAPEEQSLRCATVLSQLRERLAHLNLIAGNCDRRVAELGGDLQLILKH